MNTSSVTGQASVFFQTYKQCREAFLFHTGQAEAKSQSWVHPTLTGLEGEELAIDAAYFGPAEARRLLVLFSGCHGCEGFVGSALQLDCINRLARTAREPGNVAILLIHGVNPYGWSHFSRTNENNVDLNRNFISFSERPVEHPLAREIQNFNDYRSATGPDLERLVSEIKSLAAVHGAASVGDAIQQGQYFQPDGIEYGGDGLQWSSQVLSGIWSEYFRDRTAICIIDWHTGLGNYGEPLFLCFDPPESETYALASAWWGAEALSSADGSYQSGSRPEYSGLLISAAKRVATGFGATTISAVIEIGTFSPFEAAECLWIDRWLRHAPEDANAASVEELQVRLRRFFYPQDLAWKESAIMHGRDIIDRACRGLRCDEVSSPP